jgi:hypothetical protein
MNQPQHDKPGTDADRDRTNDISPLPTEDMVEIGSEQHPHTADDHSDRPRRDHSEREAGGDQDIDTAGQIPGNSATANKDATGF